MGPYAPLDDKDAKHPPIAAHVSLAILIKEMCGVLNKQPVRKTMVCQRPLLCWEKKNNHHSAVTNILITPEFKGGW